MCCWEVFTYGDVPYKNSPLTQVQAEMTRGVRPAKPPGCPSEIWKCVDALATKAIVIPLQSCACAHVWMYYAAHATSFTAVGCDART